VRLVLFGPQGAGKGTQAEKIVQKYSIPSIATGDIFRWAIRGGTALGLKVQAYVEAGDLVPDELTVEVMTERLEAPDCRSGFLLDGFPRTLEQAKALDRLLDNMRIALNAALVIEVPEAVSLHRISGRRVCNNCGATYHIDMPPAVDWTCDRCGGRVEQRIDDSEAAVRRRLEHYRKQTAPLKAYYRQKGLLREIDGEGTPDEVFDRITAVL
jgi:adenylate kinase